MKHPKNQLELCLYLLITERNMTPLKFIKNGLISYGQRIGDLRAKGIDVTMTKVKFTNRFKHKSEHGVWNVANKKKAMEYYKHLTKK